MPPTSPIRPAITSTSSSLSVRTIEQHRVLVDPRQDRRIAGAESGREVLGGAGAERHAHPPARDLAGRQGAAPGLGGAGDDLGGDPGDGVLQPAGQVAGPRLQSGRRAGELRSTGMRAKAASSPALYRRSVASRAV